MDKQFLKELFAMQIAYQEKIAECDNELANFQMECEHCGSNSGNEYRVEKRIYQEAETNIDALINFYMRFHGSKQKNSGAQVSNPLRSLCFRGLAIIRARRRRNGYGEKLQRTMAPRQRLQVDE